MRSRRDTELFLLLAAVPVVALAFALVHGVSGALAPIDFAAPAALFAALFAVHVAERFLAPGADPVLLPVTALLSGIGLAFVTRLDRDLAASQTMWLIGGALACALTLLAVPSLERLARYKYTVALAGIALLLLPALIGVEVNGAKLWLRFGGYSFQPAEIAKILIVLFLGAYLAENREVLSVSTRRIAGIWLPPARQLGPVVAMWLISLVVLVAEKDLGSSLLFFGVFLVMVYAATGRPGYVVLGLLMFGAGATAAYLLFGHVRDRVAIWVDPFADAAGRGYQLVQSLFALAAGGMAGVGVGRGLPTRIPFVETDFIFAAVGEELGLLGGVALLAAYLVFCLRGLATAARAHTDVAAFTATGLVAVFALQTFVIVGGVTRLIPLTGITLPFVSYGGSSVLANFILLGLLLRAGDTSAEEAELLSSGKSGVLGRVALAGRVRKVAVGVALLIVALVVNLTYIQVVAAPALAAHQGNTRNLSKEFREPRGSIVTADGVVLAESVPEGDHYRRVYPEGSFAAHVVGYLSPRYGRAGIESALDDALAGQRAFSDFRDVVEAAAGLPVPGNDVVLTIDSRVQRAAEEALAGHRGSAVVLNPKTGAVLALASAPDFDPGEVTERWEELSEAESAPLYDRSTDSLYPPGSTFKVITLSGVLANDTATPESTYAGPGRLEIGGAPITNFEGGSYGKITLRKAMSSSVNTVFAQIAVELGAERLVAQAEAFGFGRKPPVETGARASLMPEPDEMTEWETAWAGVGQPVGEHESPAGPQATPLQMALVAAGIGNDGVVMRPHLVQRIADEAGRTVGGTREGEWSTALDPGTAATVRDMMVDVVERGSGTRARISGVTVAGKTGTAEAGKSVQTHAWFIAFAPAEDPTVAIAIVLENAGVGGQVAAPAARPLLQSALEVAQ